MSAVWLLRQVDRLSKSGEGDMIFYSGRGHLLIILFFVPLLVFGTLLLRFDINVFTVQSWWPLHSLMILGAILIMVVGRLANRKKAIADVIYEKTGPVIVLESPHSLYWIPTEYWGPILLGIYFVLAALRYYTADDSMVTMLVISLPLSCSLCLRWSVCS